MQIADRAEHGTERSSHAIYGLIIITPTFVADREATEDVTSVAALFVVGAYQARHRGASVIVQLAIGALGATLGVVVILVEVLLGS